MATTPTLLRTKASSRSIHSNKGSRKNTGRSNLTARSDMNATCSAVARKVRGKTIPPLASNRMVHSASAPLLTPISTGRSGVVWLDRPSSRMSYIGCHARLRPATAELMGRDGRTKTPPGKGKPREIPRLLSTLKLRRARDNRPHHTFDLDGDGVIGQEDIANAKRFDSNNNGEMDEDEVIECRAQLVRGFYFMNPSLFSVPSKPKKYTCPFGSVDGCSYSTNQSYGMKVHIRKHTGQKPFACDECSYRSTNQSDLVRHIRKHTGEKPYHCTAVGCKYKSRTSNAFKCHMKTHHKKEVAATAAGKPERRTTSYTCNVRGCNYTCAQKDKFSDHQKKHLTESVAVGIADNTLKVIHKCSACGYLSKAQSRVRAHITQKHADIVAISVAVQCPGDFNLLRSRPATLNKPKAARKRKQSFDKDPFISNSGCYKKKPMTTSLSLDPSKSTNNSMKFLRECIDIAKSIELPSNEPQTDSAPTITSTVAANDDADTCTDRASGSMTSTASSSSSSSIITI